MKSIILIIGFIILFDVDTVVAQLIRVHATLDTNTIELGGHVNMHLSVEKPAEAIVEFPVFNDTLYEAVEIRRKSKLDSSRAGRNIIILKQQLTLTVFDTGLFYIPPVPFVYKSERFVDTIRSAANYLEVRSFPVDTTYAIRDIKGIDKVSLSFREIYPFVLIALGLILIVWFAIYYYKKRKLNEPIIARVRPVDPPDVIALNELEKLKNEKLWQQGKTKEYYSRLTEIIRTYLEGRYGIMALEQTSFEILLAVHDILGTGSNYTLLKNMLELSDLVKFAKADPEPGENMNQLENAVGFVNNTRHQQKEEAGELSQDQYHETVTDVI